MDKKEKTKKPDLDTRIGKYFLAKTQGMSKTEASEVAGYPTATHTTRIEASKAYQEIAKCYKDELLKHITMEEIAEINSRNIRQERDLGASNTALKICLEKIEPGEIYDEDQDRVYVVLK